MDPLNALRASYYIILFGIELDQVPYQVRSSLELVRTCHADLQYLIELRNELLFLLQRRPKVLERVNNIIEAAHKGLVEVCGIVEKCRPQANKGKTPFMSRVSWILWDSAHFQGQESVISRHHASVLAEMNFLREIALLAPTIHDKTDETPSQEKPSQIFDNVALLGDLMGEVTISNARGVSSSKHASTIIMNERLIRFSASKVPITAHQNHPLPPTFTAAQNLMVNTASVSCMSSPVSTYPAPPPPYPGLPDSAASQPFEGLKSFETSSSNAPLPADLSKLFPQQQAWDVSRMSKSAATASKTLGSSDADGLSLLFGEHTKVSIPVSPLLSKSKDATIPWSSDSIPPYRPVSSMSSNPSLYGFHEVSDSVTNPTHFTGSHQIQGSSTLPASNMYQLAGGGPLDYETHSRSNSGHVSTMNRGTPSSASTLQPISPHMYQQGAQSTLRSPLSSSNLYNDGLYARYDMRPTSEIAGIADASFVTQPHSKIHPGMGYNQVSTSQDGYKPFNPAQDHRDNDPRPISSVQSTPQRFMASTPAFEHQQHTVPVGPGHQQTQPYQLSSPGTIWQAQSTGWSHAQPISNHSRASTGVGMDQVGAYELMDSMPPVSQPNGAMPANRQTQPLGYNLPAINREPQELASVRFCADPAELP